jgi:hypothetical protein
VLADRGVSIIDIATLLQHSQPSFTADKYLHPQKDATKKTAKALMEAMTEKEKPENKSSKTKKT